MQYNMYHKRSTSKRPLDAQNAQPIPMALAGHARRRPKREAEGREPAAAWHGDRGAILAGAAVSPPGPQRIIAQMLRACCGIQVQVQVIKYSNNI
jgi:hypothetical protein